MNFNKLKRALWTYRQPLTKIPVNKGAPVSDAFIWRNSKDWKTFFELIDIAALFMDRNMVFEHYALIFFFNKNGQKISEDHILLKPNRRITLDLSKYLSVTSDEIGTFCVFHLFSPEEVINSGSFITERGYVSYQYNNAPVRSYVHGNLDAVALNKDNKIELLGGISYLQREYRIQHELRGVSKYELLFVNPTGKPKNLSCHVYSLKKPDSQEIYKETIGPMSISKFDVNVDETCSYRVIVKARLAMARPLVFRIQNQKTDVFHG